MTALRVGVSVGCGVGVSVGCSVGATVGPADVGAPVLMVGLADVGAPETGAYLIEAQ
jgi:hypothetical protein